MEQHEEIIFSTASSASGFHPCLQPAIDPATNRYALNLPDHRR
jgi:hypothetical protein